MRMWMIDPKKMCSQHLRGEHLEIHMFRACIEKGKKLNGYIKNGLFEYMEIQCRHDAIVSELQRRGKFNHKTPLLSVAIYRDIYGTDNMFEVALSKVDREKAENDLFSRCEKCRRMRDEK